MAARRRSAGAAASVWGAALLALLAPGAAVRADTPKTDRSVAPLCDAARAVMEETGFTADERGNFRIAGTWKVSGGATAAYLEFRIDSDRYGAEERPGTAGQWAYKDSFPECSSHTTRVHLYPVVKVAGREVICLSQDQSVFGNFFSRCRPLAAIVGCSWSCQTAPQPVCTGTCSGKASGSPLGSAAFWGKDDGGYEPSVELSKSGPWTDRITCAPGERVSFKVRGFSGVDHWSNVSEIPCGQEKPPPGPEPEPEGTPRP